MLKAIFLGNSGCCLFNGKTAILLDAPNRLHTVFDAVSESEMDEILQKEPPFDCLRAVLFSHRHSDHYDKKRLQSLLAVYPDLQVFSPSGATAPSGKMIVGGIGIEYTSVAHSGAEFADVPHVVYWIDMGDQSVYFTGDALWDKQIHLDIWNGRTPDIGIWNPNFMNHPEGRELMRMCKTNILCHLPIFSDDVLGIGRKAKTSVERYGSEIPDLVCVKEYPLAVER